MVTDRVIRKVCMALPGTSFLVSSNRDPKACLIESALAARTIISDLRLDPAPEAEGPGGTAGELSLE